MKNCSYPRCDCNIVYTGPDRQPPVTRCPRLQKQFTREQLKNVEDTQTHLNNAAPTAHDEFIATEMLLTVLEHRDPAQRIDMISNILRWHSSAFLVETLNALLPRCEQEYSRLQRTNPSATFGEVVIVMIDALGAEMTREANAKSEVVSNLLDLLRSQQTAEPTLPPIHPYRATSERT